MRMRYLIAAAIGLVAGLLLLVLWRTPRVTAWLPDTNEIRAGQSISLETNVPMSGEDFRSRFQISPTVSGDLRIEGRSIHFNPDEPLDYGQSYTITLSPGMRGENSLLSLKTYEKQYTVSEPELLFALSDHGATNLWRQDASGEVFQITDEQWQIWDYSILPSGEGVLISSFNDDGSTDLFRVFLSGERDLILDCEGYRCLDGRWQPDGILVAFEKSNGSTEIWLIDTESGTEMPLSDFAFSSDDGNRLGPSRYARWSTDGRYLSFYMPDRQQLAVLDMRNKDLRTIPANVDLMGEWSWSGHQLAFTELVLNESLDEENHEDSGSKALGSGPSFSSRVKVLDVETNEMLNLGGANMYLEGVPEWSSDETIIAVSRMQDGIRHFWTLALDGSDPETIIDAWSYTYSAPRSSPDGQHLAFMRSQRVGFNKPAGVWLLDLEEGQAELVAERAFLPDWLP